VLQLPGPNNFSSFFQAAIEASKAFKLASEAGAKIVKRKFPGGDIENS
jgi:hypothetical protein